MAKRKVDTSCCSFCGKSQKEVKLLIASPAGPAVQICNLCVDICNKIISDGKQREAAAPTATEEGRGKEKVPKKGAAGTAKKQAGQPRRTKSIAPGIL